MYVENRTKLANFLTPRVFNAPDEGVTLGIEYRRTESKKAIMTGLADDGRSFKTGSAV